MDTKKLRQKILDLAIHGKLVPQDPNDEPASVLLERIRAEKERLIKEGKIKRSKKSASDTPHYPEAVPFEVPESWEWTTINDICSKIGSGSTPRGSNYAEEGIPFFRSQNVYNDGLVYDDIKYISEEIHENMIGTEVRAQDLLLNITGGSLGRCAIIPDEFRKGNVSQHVCILRTIVVLPAYLHLFIISDYFASTMILSGSGREGLPKYSLEIMQIPLPPYEEQKRIVAAIEKWFTLIDTLETAKADLQSSITQAKSMILDLAIHGKLVPQDPNDEPAIELLKRINPKFIPCDNAHYENEPSNWAVCKVKDVFRINPKTKADDGMEAGFVPMSNIQDSYNNNFSYELRTWGNIKKGYTHFEDGDIVVAKISPCLENRKSAVIVGLPNGIGAGTTELNVFRSDYVYPLYGLFFFKSDYFISQCVGTFNGVVGQQRVSTKIIEDMVFPVPPRPEQERIINKVNELFQILDNISAEL